MILVKLSDDEGVLISIGSLPPTQAMMKPKRFSISIQSNTPSLIDSSSQSLPYPTPSHPTPPTASSLNSTTSHRLRSVLWSIPQHHQLPNIPEPRWTPFQLTGWVKYITVWDPLNRFFWLGINMYVNLKNRVRLRWVELSGIGVGTGMYVMSRLSRLCWAMQDTLFPSTYQPFQSPIATEPVTFACVV